MLGGQGFSVLNTRKEKPQLVSSTEQAHFKHHSLRLSTRNTIFEGTCKARGEENAPRVENCYNTHPNDHAKHI